MDKIETGQAVLGGFWQLIPLDIVLSAVAIFTAAGLKLAGVFS